MGKFEVENNNNFVKKWSTVRKQGKTKYILIFSVIFTAGLLIGRIGICLYTGNNFNSLQFLVLFISILLARIYSWTANEKKYTEKLEKQSQEENTMKI